MPERDWTEADRIGFRKALEKELAHVVTEQEKERARARLQQMKGGEQLRGQAVERVERAVCEVA